MTAAVVENAAAASRPGVGRRLEEPAPPLRRSCDALAPDRLLKTGARAGEELSLSAMTAGFLRQIVRRNSKRAADR